MMRRIGRSNNRNSNSNTTPDGYPDDEPSIQGVGSLLGADVASLLDGESVILPSDDDASSINTNFNYSTAGNDNDPEQLRASSHDQDDDSTTNGPWMMGGVNQPNWNADSKAANDANLNDNTNGTNNDSQRRSCLPPWLANSPKWLKTAIVIATALLVGAIVLVTVAAVLNNGNNGASSRSAVEPSTPSAAPTSLKPSSPRPTPEPSKAPKGSTEQPSVAPVTGAPVTGAPVDVTLPSSPPSLASPTKTVFYVTGGRPQGTDLADFEANLGRLPVDASFMVNVGDWNSPFATSCDEASFQDVDALFETSTVPVYFVPGDNEYNDCPDITQSYTLWKEYLVDYETKHWPPPSWTVNRYTGVLDENWAFTLNKALFVGINLVGGQVQDTTEWATRQAADLEWIDVQVDAARKNQDLEVLVVFAHADPSISTNDPFFVPFFDNVRSSYNVPTVLVHRNLGIDSANLQENYMGINDFAVLVVEGGIWPPMRVEVDTLSGSFLWNQADWFV